MNIKQAIAWAEDLTKNKQEIHCVIACEALGVYIVLKRTEVKNETKIVYTGG